MVTIAKISGYRSRVINTIIDALARQRPIPGPGLLATEGPGGTVLSLARRSPASGAPHAWAVRAAGEGAFQVYIPDGSARVILVDPDPDAENRLAAVAVSVGLAAVPGEAGWYAFDAAAGSVVWARVSGGEVVVGTEADEERGALIAAISDDSSVTQVARSPLEFFLPSDDPDARDAPEPQTPPPDDACDQNTHPGQTDGHDPTDQDDADHPGSGSGSDADHPGYDPSDQDDSDHPAAADCYTTT